MDKRDPVEMGKALMALRKEWPKLPMHMVADKLERLMPADGSKPFMTENDNGRVLS